MIHLILYENFKHVFVFHRKLSKKQLILITLTTLTVLAAVAVAVVITLYCFKHKSHYHGVRKTQANAELYQHGAVATDAVKCSEIGNVSNIEISVGAVDKQGHGTVCLSLLHDNSNINLGDGPSK